MFPFILLQQLPECYGAVIEAVNIDCDAEGEADVLQGAMIRAESTDDTAQRSDCRSAVVLDPLTCAQIRSREA